MAKTRLWDRNCVEQQHCYDIGGDELLQIWGENTGGKELQSLWRAVIAQTLSDALNCSKKLANRMERARAIAWFSLRNKDFLTVCAYADLNPEYVMDKVRTMLAKPRA